MRISDWSSDVCSSDLLWPSSRCLASATGSCFGVPVIPSAARELPSPAMKQIPRCARDDRYAFGVTDMRSGRWICVRGDGYALFRSAPDLSPSPMRRSPPGRSRCPGPEKLAAEAAPARAAHRTTSGGVERVGEPLHRDHFHALVAAAL